MSAITTDDEIKAARHRCRYGNATGADRVLLAVDDPENDEGKPYACNRLGPVEHSRCHRHPKFSYTYRWYWEAPAWHAAEIAAYGRPGTETAPTDFDLLQQTGEVEKLTDCKRCRAEADLFWGLT